MARPVVPLHAVLPRFSDPEGEFLDHAAVELAIDRHLGFAPPANEDAIVRAISRVSRAVPRAVVITLAEAQV